jgi:hypothetical protein
MDQVTVLEMALRLAQVMARGMGLEKDLRLVLGMGQEMGQGMGLAMGQGMGLATVRDLVQVSENH